MRRTLAVVSLALLTAGCRTTEDMQRDYAKTLTPRAVDATGAPAPEGEAPRALQTFRVRVYADGDYQRQALRWQDRIAEQFERANRVLGAQFGVQLEVVVVRSWGRSGHSDSLDTVVDELRTTDPGADVDWVVGFVSSVEVLAASLEQLGRGYFFGRHLVLRGMLSLAETDALNKTLDRLSDSERDHLVGERRLHKETAVLLHEWAHTLGAFHDLSADWLMSPYYDAKQISFSPATLDILRVGLRYRNASDPAGREAWGRSYRETVEKIPEGMCEAKSRAQALGWVEQAMVASPHSTATTPAGPSPSGAGERELDRALSRERAGDLKGAWEILEPAARAAPDDAQVHEYFCDLSRRRARRAPETVAACRRAAEMAGARPQAMLLLAWTLVDRKEVPEALKVLFRVDALLPPTTSPEDWAHLAQLYDRAGTCSAAERVASHARENPAAAQVLADCTRQRRWVGLPRDTRGVPVEREHAYVQAVEAAQSDVESRRLDRACQRARELDRNSPGSLGASLIVCLVESRGKDAVRTRSACSAAVAAVPEAWAPHYMLGMEATRSGRLDEARLHLPRTVELKDGIGEAWLSLATAYERLGDRAALEALKSRYRKRFGRNLQAGR